MSATAYIAGGLALGALHRLLRGSDDDHDDVLEATYHELREETDSSTNIAVAHIQSRSGVDANGHVRSATPGEDHEPDLVVESFVDNKLVVEVETGDTLDGEAMSQLEDFSTSGYTRVLVVPEGDVDAGETFLSGTGEAGRQPVAVCSPGGVTEFL